MIRVVIDVSNEATRTCVVIQARSLRGAVSAAAAAYPDADVRVRFPIEPEAFFVEDPAARAEMVSLGRPDELAA